MSQWLNLSLGVNSLYKAPEDKLSDLNPYAVYGSTDLMGTGGDIVKLKRASDNAEQNFTEAELWGSAYDTFASGTTTTVTMLYDQVAGAGASSNTHLQQTNAATQPTRNSSSVKSFGFDRKFLYSNDISTISDRPDFDGDITLASRLRSNETSNTTYANPLFTYYQADNAGSLNFVPVHSAPHRQLVSQHFSGNETFKADDFGSSAKSAFVSAGSTPNPPIARSVLSVHTSQTDRTVKVQGVDAVNNTDDCGTISEGTITKFGIGGWQVASVWQDAQQDFNLSCSVIFDRALSSDDQATLLSILDGLSV